jgi:hypothetical protein
MSFFYNYPKYIYNMNRPSIKQIRGILNVPSSVTGRNDVRAGGGRIRLNINLSKEREADLEIKLSVLYPHLTISVTDDIISNSQSYEDHIVTVIHYTDLNKVLSEKQERNTPPAKVEDVIPELVKVYKESDDIDPVSGVLVGVGVGIVMWIILAAAAGIVVGRLIYQSIYGL